MGVGGVGGGSRSRGTYVPGIFLQERPQTQTQAETEWELLSLTASYTRKYMFPII